MSEPMIEARAESYWMASSDATSYPALTEDTAVDVAVIGGGIAGLCTAWELARAGRSPVVLEADRIAAGITGFTTGRLSSAHPWIYAPLRDSLGPGTARLYARSQQEAVDHVVRTAGELGIDCDLEKRASHVYVEPADRIPELKDEVEAVREAGLDASFVTDTDLPYEVAGALRVEDQVQFHPRRFLLGLADDLLRNGGRIHERTRVLDLHDGEGRPARLTTATGATVLARDVVVATLFPIFHRSLLDFRLIPLRELVIAAPIDEDRDPGAMYITREENTRSVRTAPYGDGKRLLLITGEAFAPGTGGVADRRHRLVEWTREHFEIDKVDYWWSAQDLDTTDKVPYVGQVDDHLYVATGYARSGMSHGVMSGRLLAAQLTGEELPWAELYAPRRAHPAREAAPVVRSGLSYARRFVEDRVRARGGGTEEDIKPGTGAVVHRDGRPCAVYREHDGSTRVLSARCTHLGCLVAFDDVERVWECPCHGSRYAPDGSVLQGPATEPLDELEP
ncbi:FAD-dependent oxidoreductase [Spirillospora sp. CA-294931]|uniref:FAD-dependent oxidoreductase n=1 Tax=Spirillospora sp. CA-294931 TaxID=3240042 RepID=UPI003D8C63E0